MPAPIETSSSRPLDPIDAAWYQLDRRGRTLDIGALLLFDDPLEDGAVEELICRALTKHRRFRQRVVQRPFGIGMPRWENMPHFRVDAHVHHLAVPQRGDDLALARLVGDLMSQPMDLDRPLWDLYILDRAGGRSAILARFHHCMGDGFALGHLLLCLGQPKGRPEYSPSEDGDTQLTENWLHRLRQLTNDPEKTVGEARRTARAIAHLLTMPVDSESLLRRPLSDVRRAAWSDCVELARVKKLGVRFDATVNDILMNALTGALRTYLIDCGEPVSELRIRAAMPVNLRPVSSLEEMPDVLGNHFGLAFVDLPVDQPTPQQRLQELQTTIQTLKNSPEAIVAFRILQALGRTPAYFEQLVEKHFVKKSSLVASNVPGPKEHLYFAGKRLEDVIFWPAHSGGLGLSMSIMSYAGRIRIGIRSDADVVADPARLANLFHGEFERLERRSV